jgi:hypothetical protein
MKACAASYALTYATTQKLHSLSRTAVGLTAAKFRPLVLPVHGFSLSSTTYSWIYML